MAQTQKGPEVRYVAWKVVPYFQLETYVARGIGGADKIAMRIYEDHDEAMAAAERLDPGNALIEGLTQERYDRIKGAGR